MTTDELKVILQGLKAVIDAETWEGREQQKAFNRGLERFFKELTND